MGRVGDVQDGQPRLHADVGVVPLDGHSGVGVAADAAHEFHVFDLGGGGGGSNH